MITMSITMTMTTTTNMAKTMTITKIIIAITVPLIASWYTWHSQLTWRLLMAWGLLCTKISAIIRLIYIGRYQGSPHNLSTFIQNTQLKNEATITLKNCSYHNTVKISVYCEKHVGDITDNINFYWTGVAFRGSEYFQNLIKVQYFLCAYPWKKINIYSSRI